MVSAWLETVYLSAGRILRGPVGPRIACIGRGCGCFVPFSGDLPFAVEVVRWALDSVFRERLEALFQIMTSRPPATAMPVLAGPAGGA